MSLENFIDNGFYRAEIRLLAEQADMIDKFPDCADSMTSGSCWTELMRAKCIEDGLKDYAVTDLGKQVLQYLIDNPYKFDESGYVRVLDLDKYQDHYEFGA